MDKGSSSIILRYFNPRGIKGKLSDMVEGLMDSLRGPGSQLTNSVARKGPLLNLSQFFSSIPLQEMNDSYPFADRLKPEKTIEYIVKSSWPDIQLPHTSVKISDYMFKAFEKYSDRTALIDSLTHKSMSFTDLVDKSRRIANALSLRSVSYGHIAAIVCSNTPDFLPIFLALNKLGATVSLISPQSTKDEIVFYLNETKTQTVFAQYSLLHTVRDAVNQVPSFKSDNLFSIEPLTDSYTSMIKDTSITMPLNYPITNQSVTDLCPKIFTVSDLCRENVESATQVNNVEEPTQRVAVIPFSSGTTGKPKGVMLSNFNILANIIQSQCVIGDNVYKVVSGLLPFFHIYGFTVNLLNSLSLGNTVVTFSTLEPSVFLKGLEKYKVSFLFIVPTVAQFLNNYRHLRKFDLSAIQTVFNGASKLPKSQALTFKKLFAQPLQIVQGYGMTEMSPVSHAMPINSQEYNESIGLTVPNTLCKVIDVDTKESLRPHHKGELCIKGPQVMIGYLNRPKETADMIQDGWLHTGDIAYYDENGAFYLTDRMKELIKYKGFQVAPAEVESHLLAHPDVADAVVVGVPHESAGELPTAFIVPKHKNVMDPSSIHDYLAGKLSSHKWLRGGIHYVPSIPKSAAGKVLRKDVKALAMENPPKTVYHKWGGVNVGPREGKA